MISVSKVSTLALIISAFIAPSVYAMDNYDFELEIDGEQIKVRMSPDEYKKLIESLGTPKNRAYEINITNFDNISKDLFEAQKQLEKEANHRRDAILLKEIEEYEAREKAAAEKISTSNEVTLDFDNLSPELIEEQKRIAENILRKETREFLTEDKAAGYGILSGKALEDFIESTSTQSNTSKPSPRPLPQVQENHPNYTLLCDQMSDFKKNGGGTTNQGHTVRGAHLNIEAWNKQIEQREKQRKMRKEVAVPSSPSTNANSEKEQQEASERRMRSLRQLEEKKQAEQKKDSERNLT